MMIGMHHWQTNSRRFLMSLKAELPSYAIPLFLRVVRNLDITGLEDGHNHTFGLKFYVSGTFKIRKLDLVREGYNPQLVWLEKFSHKCILIVVIFSGQRSSLLLQQFERGLLQARLLPLRRDHQHALPPLVTPVPVQKILSCDSRAFWTPTRPPCFVCLWCRRVVLRCQLLTFPRGDIAHQRCFSRKQVWSFVFPVCRSLCNAFQALKGVGHCCTGLFVGDCRDW